MLVPGTNWQIFMQRWGKRDVPYKSLLKVFLFERIDAELHWACPEIQQAFGWDFDRFNLSPFHIDENHVISEKITGLNAEGCAFHQNPERFDRMINTESDDEKYRKNI